VQTGRNVEGIDAKRLQEGELVVGIRPLPGLHDIGAVGARNRARKALSL
jgi:hypothetical protein